MIHRAITRAVFVFVTGAAFTLAPAFCQAQPSAYMIATFAGNGTAAFAGDGGPPINAEFNLPYGVALDKSGNLYIADQLNHRIREVSNGSVSTVAGNGTAGYTGDKATATGAELDHPSGVAVDSSGNIYIADTNNCVIRKVAGGTITTYVGNSNFGVNCGASGDHGQAVNAQLANPTGVALDAAGNLYIADTGNNVIRVVTASTGIITTLSTGNSVILKGPRGVAVDASGNVYIADTGNSRVRKVAPSGSVTVTTTVAGTGVAGFTGDGGPAGSAQLSSPSGVAVDAAGNLYIVDTNNNRIRKVSAATGIITTIAGSRSGYAGDGGPATAAQLLFPRAAVLDASGKIYIADNQNNVIRLLTLYPPAIAAGGVVTASAFGGFTSIAPGAWVEIYGTGLATDSLDWSAAFSGVNAPTSLGGTTVTIGGQAAYIAYASPSQVNAQVPSNVGTGQQQVTVKTSAGTSSSFAVTVNPTAAGMWAPTSFNIGGTQYLGAWSSDFQYYILPPGALSGFNLRRAKPGDIIILFGVGFGPVTPATPDGQLVQVSNTLTLPLQVFFGSTVAKLQYSGLVPGYMGLYQFNVVVPNIPASDTVPVTFTLGGVSGAQGTLYTAVGN